MNQFSITACSLMTKAMIKAIGRQRKVTINIPTPSGLKNLTTISSEKPNVGASPTAAGS